ncbi:MAG: hypothetical protein JWP48_1874 [Actinoallomurus sp.]|jgi:hypothetical protein|nr:hypothetical protein [Actinoallomurus sp.]
MANPPRVTGTPPQVVRTNVDYRLDTTDARDFLGHYVTLP